MYTAEISRVNPSCILFLIDQSGSMNDPFGGAAAGTSKAQGVADAINRLLQTLVVKCSKEEGVRDYYQIGVLGYGGGAVGPAFGGALAGQGLVPISQLAVSPLRIEERARKVDDGAGGLVETVVKFPVWFDAQASLGTPMCEALGQATSLLADWVRMHPTAFPPIVINITDGEATDGDPRGPAYELWSLATSDGNVMLFNIHLSSRRDPAIEFPDDEMPLPDRFAALLYEMSSILPEHMCEAARAEGYRVSSTTHGFVFNGDLTSVIRAIDIGTRPSNMR